MVDKVCQCGDFCDDPGRHMACPCSQKYRYDYYCDVCGEQDETVYEYDGDDYCLSCLIKRLEEDGVITTKGAGARW